MLSGARAAVAAAAPSAVLVHGAFGDGSDWAQIIPLLQARGIQAKAFDDRTTVAAWRTRPSWYIVSADDRIISPDLERAMAKRIGATTTSLPTSHMPRDSRPADVAAVIIAAVDAGAK